MRHSERLQPTAALAAQDKALSQEERAVLVLLMQGVSRRTVGRRLALSDASVSAYRRELMRKFAVSTITDLAARGAVPIASDVNVLASQGTAQLQRQSRWLPNAALSLTRPIGAACRRIFHAHSLRDVADALRDCADRPNPVPDDLSALLTHLSGTLGAKQALLAALAAECGHPEVQLMLACHELQVPGASEPGGRHLRLPIVVCFLRCRAREIQISRAETGSVLYGRALSAMSVEPSSLAGERVKVYQSFAADWCRALDIEPEDFAQRRAQVLRSQAPRAVIEDLLGYLLPLEYVPRLH